MAPPPVQKKSEPFVLFFRVLRHQPSIDAFDQSRGIVSYKNMDGQHNWTARGKADLVLAWHFALSLDSVGSRWA